MSEMKPTPGPWEAIEKQDADPSEGTHWLRCPIGALGYWRGHKRDHEDCHWVLNGADARLIAEAGTVFHNTGLSPVQLVEMVRELKVALQDAEEYISGHTPTNSWGLLDRQEDADRCETLEKVRAALAKCEGVGND